MKKISEIKQEWLKDQIDSLKSRGISKADIARDLDVLPQYLNSITNGGRSITDSFMDKFILVYKITQIELAYPRYKETNDASISDNQLKYFIDRIEAQAKEIGRLEQEVSHLKLSEKNTSSDSDVDVRGVISVTAG